ncbi:MAG: hypothetical protein RJB24_413 [Candidatus Parcubacteria bacterium]
MLIRDILFMARPINSEKIVFCSFTEAILAESGILTIAILGYDITKSIIYRISPRLYTHLAPLRTMLSISSRRNKTPEG